MKADAQYQNPSEQPIDKATATRALVDGALDSLGAALERGESETLRTYLATMGRFHAYSFGNVLLIATQCPDASRVAGFQTWKKLGRFVRKGEKGIRILAPIVSREKAEANPDTMNHATATPADAERRVRGFMVVHVFDVAQTDGEPLPDIGCTQGEPGAALDALRALVADRGIAVTYRDDWSPNHRGASYGGRIELLAGMSAADEFSVLVHEFAHELLHRDKDTRPDKTAREVEAEAVAFVVCTAAGLDAGTAHSDYVQLYGGKRETLQASLTRIQKTAAEIIDSAKIGGAS